MAEEEDRELSLTQAAAYFGVHPDTLKDTLIPRYNIPYRQDKRRKFFRQRDLKIVKERMYEDKEST